MNQPPEEIRFKVLTLDGGGAKGFYTLGILRELEAAAGKLLAQFFDAIYGTSTGAIIATLLGLGRSVPETLKLYEEHVPRILGAKDAAAKSTQLKKTAEELFKCLGWGDFRTAIGIVATNWTREKPLLFKNKQESVHGMKATFIPGFGCTIAEAVRASCSATPFFEPCPLDLKNDGKIEARDGGFCANNPSLFTLTDVLNGYLDRDRADGRYAPAQQFRNQRSADSIVPESDGTANSSDLLNATGNELPHLRKLLLSPKADIFGEARTTLAFVAEAQFDVRPNRFSAS